MPGEPARDCFVVRGGLFAAPEDLLAAVGRICREGYVKNGRVRLSTVGALVDAGFRVELDVTDGQPNSHHNVVFPDPPDLGQAKLFIQCFDAPIPNPAKE